MKILTSGKYYGAKKSEVGFNGVILSEYDYLTPKTDWHYHENPYFMYILHGNLFDVNSKSRTCCASGSLVFHNWQEAHFNTKETALAGGFHIEFERNWFEQKRIDIDLWQGSRIIRHPGLYHLLAKLYFEFRNWDSYSELSAELLLLQLCEGTEKMEFLSGPEPSWIGLLKQILQEEKDIPNLKSLSALLGVHPVHISRAIPKYLDCSLGDYIRQRKIKQALHYLLNPDYSLTEIAMACGFADQSHFIRTFKTFFKQTPGAFRKELQ